MDRDDGVADADHDTRREGSAAAVEDAHRIADERREDGWEAVVVPAVDTAPVPDDADRGYSGFVHVVPESVADEVAAACERAAFPQYDAYRRQVGGDLFFVVELLDPATETVVLIAGTYRATDAVALYRQASREGTVRTHLKRLNGERLGSVEHESIEKLFPEGIETLAGRS
ncbi:MULTISPECIES: DUF7529 family protein [Halolamina]|uniref:Uncharacterized protein n=1 Tax=Halolamina pelagica TaxID=699431 RepID=A0A1I5MM01_9EURY|nr:MULTISPECIES: hypothetical protein [Halolamina]NHX36083.1 hypothetical protein [Halolamina sp. R1-12]SFP10628.1 hypothetical protein SAMN05216277_101327 [Halolamina pelagica]